MKRPPVWIAFFTLLNVLLLLAAAVPAWRVTLWGADAWTFLGALPIAAVAAAAIAATVCVLAAPPFPARAGALVLWAVAGGTVAWLLHDRTHLLGDGRLWLAVLRGHPAWHPHEPLAFAGARLAALLAFGRSQHVTGLVEIWNVLLGCAALALMLLLSRRLAADRPGRWLALALLISLGVLQFAFGYVEAYGALGVAVLLFLISGTDAIERRTGLAWPALAFGLAAGVHGSGFLLAPALLVVILARRGSLRHLAISLAAALLPLAVAYAVIPIVMPGASSAGAGGGTFDFGWRGWRELLGGLAFFRGGFAAWLLGQTNRWILLGGAAIALLAARVGLAAAGGGKLGDGEAAAPAPPGPEAPPARRLVPIFLALAAVGLYAPALVLDMEGSRGAAADWDSFAVAAIPLAALAAWTWMPFVRRRGVRPAIALSIAVGLFGTLSFIVVNATPGAALARFESLAASEFRTARSRSWAYETLALYRREQGDMNGAADDYALAIRSQPDNPRLLRNAAGALSRVGRSREAAAALYSLTRVDASDFNAWLHLGMEWDAAGASDSAVVALRQAVRLKPESLDAMNELARLLLGMPDRMPEGRREAYQLLRRSLDADPRQQHAAEMRQAMTRLEAEGAARP